MIKTIRLLTLLLLASPGAPSWAGASDTEAGRLMVAYVDFPPFTYTSEQGEAAGYLNDLTRTVAHHAGLNVGFIELPPARLERNLRQGKVHIFQGIRTLADQSNDVIAGQCVLMPINLAVFQHPDAPPFSGMDNLAGARVGVMLGYSYGGLLETLEQRPDLSLVKLTSRPSSLSVLMSGRIDYLLDYVRPVQEARTEMKLPELQQTVIASIHTSWLVTSKLEDPQSVLMALENAYRQTDGADTPYNCSNAASPALAPSR